LDGKENHTRFIEFAPAPALSRLLKSFPQLEYRSADLYDKGADDQVDLTNLPYSDCSFDAFLSSHMLEHIEDDGTAMRELYRILEPGGWGIVMVPIQLDLERTVEGLPLTSEGERWKYYGQDDHVRMYSKQDFIDRLCNAGFQVKQLNKNDFGDESFHIHGIHPRSVLYVVERSVA
jgi:predicted SAM-dependent methyltransferase